MSVETGSRIFDYEVTGVLGTGGMGKVYKVRNVISDRTDAMKVLLPNLSDQPELADRFLREIKVLASLNHPNIAAFHTALRFENQLIMIMELVNGMTLSDKLARGRLPLEEGLAYTKQMLSALAYAHGQGIIHRDIKPANMMITPEGRIKLMDFGIAKAANDPHLTRTGTTVGSLYYISPEQLSGGKLDARSDLYSLGVTMYEITTGKRPFEGKSEYSLMAAHLQEPPRPPAEIDPNLPPMVNTAILKSLEKNPDKRFQTADEFRSALAPPAQGLASKPGAAESPAAAGAAFALRQEPPSHRGRYMLLGAVVAIILIVAGVTQLPKWFKARATPGSNAPAAAQSSPASASASQTQPAPENPQSLATTPQASVPQTSAGGEAATSSSSPGQATKAAGAGASGTVKGREAAERAGTRLLPARRPAQPPSQPSPARTASPAPNPEAATTAGVDHASQDAAALQPLEDRMSQLSGRANAVKTTVANLQQQEAATGNSLRPDVLASESRMERYMDQADSALTARNAALAKHNMDLAEREISSLESFLGR